MARTLASLSLPICHSADGKRRRRSLWRCGTPSPNPATTGVGEGRAQSPPPPPPPPPGPTALWQEMLARPAVHTLVKLEIQRLIREGAAAGPTRRSWRTHVPPGFRDAAVVRRAARTGGVRVATDRLARANEEFGQLTSLAGQLYEQTRRTGSCYESPLLVPLMDELSDALAGFGADVRRVPSSDERELPVDPLFPARGFVRRRCCCGGGGGRGCARGALRSTDVPGVLSVYAEGVFQAHYAKTKAARRTELLQQAVRNLARVGRLAPSWVDSAGPSPSPPDHGDGGGGGVVELAAESFDTQPALRQVATAAGVQRALEELYAVLPKRDGRLRSEHFAALAFLVFRTFAPSCRFQDTAEIADEELGHFASAGRGRRQFCDAVLEWVGLFVAAPTEAAVGGFVAAAQGVYEAEHAVLMREAAFTALVERYGATGASPHGGGGGGTQVLPRMEFHTLAPPLKHKKEVRESGLQELAASVPAGFREMFLKARTTHQLSCKHDVPTRPAAGGGRAAHATVEGDLEVLFPMGCCVVVSSEQACLSGMAGKVRGYQHGSVVVAFKQPLGDIPVSSELLRREGVAAPAAAAAPSFRGVKVLTGLKGWRRAVVPRTVSTNRLHPGERSHACLSALRSSESFGAQKVLSFRVRRE